MENLNEKQSPTSSNNQEKLTPRFNHATPQRQHQNYNNNYPTHKKFDNNAHKHNIPNQNRLNIKKISIDHEHESDTEQNSDDEQKNWNQGIAEESRPQSKTPLGQAYQTIID